MYPDYLDNMLIYYYDIFHRNGQDEPMTPVILVIFRTNCDKLFEAYMVYYFNYISMTKNRESFPFYRFFDELFATKFSKWRLIGQTNGKILVYTISFKWKQT